MKRLHTNYKVADDVVVITVVVGNGQMGNTLVAVDDRVLANTDDINELEIGTAADLKGKTLYVITTVSQTNVALPDAIVSYRMRGGAEPRDYVLDDDFGDGSVQVQFLATFDLVGAP